MASDVHSSCSFKLRVPMHHHKSTLMKKWEIGEKLWISHFNPTTLGAIDENGEFVGFLPYFLNDILLSNIAATPNGHFECEVEKIYPYTMDYGTERTEMISVLCRLHDSPALPDTLGGQKNITVYASFVKGVKHGKEREESCNRIINEQLFPPLRLVRDRQNVIDLSAIFIYAVIDGSMKQLGYVDGHDASEICLLASTGKRYFARLTSMLRIEGGDRLYYEIIMTDTDAAGFEVLS